MKSLAFVLSVVGVFVLMRGVEVDAWGGLFNRFSPEILANLGYGGHGGGASYRPQQYYETAEIEEEPFSNEKPCYGHLCTSNEYCCSGTVCSEWDGNYGRCVFVHGRRLGEVCRRDADCDSGLICSMSAGSLTSTCAVPQSSPKQYNEECISSSECDIKRGLCCQLQRRHRQAHRKACAYFKNPLICIGTVASDLVRDEIYLSGAEKRLTD